MRRRALVLEAGGHDAIARPVAPRWAQRREGSWRRGVEMNVLSSLRASESWFATPSPTESSSGVLRHHLQGHQGDEDFFSEQQAPTADRADYGTTSLEVWVAARVATANPTFTRASDRTSLRPPSSGAVGPEPNHRGPGRSAPAPRPRPHQRLRCRCRDHRWLLPKPASR
jgi:hypothetical protein